MIQFLCPNGHKIRCADDRAGKAAKCPACGVKFRVPSPGELEDSEPDPIPVEFAEPREEMDEPVGGARARIAVGAADGEGQIEFLCPNEHLLHGPDDLQGQPGECPECGSKFRIPSYDEVEDKEEAEEVEPEPTLPPIRGADTAITSHSPLRSIGELVVEPMQGESIELVGPVPPSLPTPRDESEPSIAALFPRLWAAKSEGATIELRCADNQRITPDRFLSRLSRGTHALFAMDEPNRTYTLMAVAWDSISCVVVRGVKTLPNGSE